MFRGISSKTPETVSFLFFLVFLLACLFLCVFLKLWRVIHCVTAAINGVKQRRIVRVHWTCRCRWMTVKEDLCVENWLTHRLIKCRNFASCSSREVGIILENAMSLYRMFQARKCRSDATRSWSKRTVQMSRPVYLCARCTLKIMFRPWDNPLNIVKMQPPSVFCCYCNIASTKAVAVIIIHLKPFWGFCKCSILFIAGISFFFSPSSLFSLSLFFLSSPPPPFRSCAFSAPYIVMHQLIDCVFVTVRICFLCAVLLCVYSLDFHAKC